MQSCIHATHAVPVSAPLVFIGVKNEKIKEDSWKHIYGTKNEMIELAWTWMYNKKIVG